MIRSLMEFAQGLNVRFFLCRHGAHENNILTDKGRSEVQTSAVAVVTALHSSEIKEVALCYSPVPRALQSAGLYAAVLENSGVKVTDHGPLKGLVPAEGLAKAIGNTLPKYGPDGQCIQAWRELPLDGCEERALEPYQMVASRVSGSIATLGFSKALVAVFHGGAIEAVSDMEFVPSGGVVEVSRHGRFLFDPQNPANPFVKVM